MKKERPGVIRNGKGGKDRLKGSLRKDTLAGAAGDDTLYGLAGNDMLKGDNGNDILDGGLGKDVMMGGRGNDTYFVDNRLDRIVENGGSNQGIDTVNAAISWSLGNNLENLILTGTEATKGTGNRLDNSLTGNAAINALNGGKGNDTLTGAGGDDTLTGGSGNDQFVYSTGKEFATLDVGVDTITDFVAGTDKIVVSKATFSTIGSVVGNGLSVATDFSVVATDAEVGLSTAFMVYSTESKGVFYNQNGALDGLGTGAKFATLSNADPAASLAATDFVVQA